VKTGLKSTFTETHAERVLDTFVARGWSKFVLQLMAIVLALALIITSLYTGRGPKAGGGTQPSQMQKKGKRKATVKGKASAKAKGKGKPRDESMEVDEGGKRNPLPGGVLEGRP